MIASSRPLRFVVLLLGGWVTMRTAQLWPVAGPIPALLGAIAPPLDATPITREIVPGAIAPRPPARVSRAIAFTPSATIVAPVPPPQPGTRAPDPVRIALALAAFVRFGPALAVGGGPIGSPLPAAPEPVDRAPSRLRASAWTIVRGGGTASPFAPQLGGSQAGVRLTYAIDEARRLALAGRLSTALGSRQREAAIGIDWQPTALPIHVVAEQRIAIEGARGGPSIGAIAGMGPTPIAAGFRLEAYGQAGGIGRDGGVDGYADGAARVARPVATIARATIDLGLGAWGGAQRGATRLDVGPTSSVSLPVGGKTVRVSLDWRQRIAGDARPGSGPAFSIGTDF